VLTLFAAFRHKDVPTSMSRKLATTRRLRAGFAEAQPAQRGAERGVRVGSGQYIPHILQRLRGTHTAQP
jgi:hypothetical protein